MLTVDVVRVSRKKGVLQVVPHGGLLPRRAAEMITDVLSVCHEHHGLTRGALLEALNDVVVEAKEDKALRAAKKLVLDRLAFAAREDVDPPALRHQLFTRAAAVRATDGVFDRGAIVAAVAADSALAPADVEAGLYADLEDAHIVDVSGLAVDGAVMLPDWIERELQAVLLRANEIVVDVDATPADVRRLLRALKLQQLLFRVEASGTLSLRLIIDGPMGLFSSSSRYGLKLALLLPHIRACRKHHVSAQVQLRKGGKVETFVCSGTSTAHSALDDSRDDALPPHTQQLLSDLPALLPPGCTVTASTELLAVDGHGALVPDVSITSATGARVCVEVLGFWSRPAVWKRVELVERGLVPVPVVFCYSDRLRVSEEAIDDDRASLCAFKGVLSSRRVADKISALLAAHPAPLREP
jgi:uncharacterized protein